MAGSKGGRPPHEPTERTRAEVQALASFGTPQNEVAAYIGISKHTLEKHYSEELHAAETKANAQVGRFLFRAASGQAMRDGAPHSDCVRAAMFWAKTRMGWRETNHLEHTGKDGGPIQTESKVDASQLSDDALDELMKAREQ